MKFNIQCSIYMAKEKKAGDLYKPNEAAALKHEKCHCEDQKKIWTDFFNNHNVTGPGFSSAQTCMEVASGLSEALSAKLQDYHSHEHRDPKYGPGGDCYATSPGGIPPGY